MNKNLKAESVKVGKDGKEGVSLTGPDTANGTDGKVAVTDKNGKDAVSMSGKDGIGHIGLTGKNGRNADIIADIHCVAFTYYPAAFYRADAGDFVPHLDSARGRAVPDL